MQVQHYALELLRSRGVVFTNRASADGVIPDSTIRRVMQRAGVANSPHGFRSKFGTWAQEHGENWEVVEIRLSHRVGGSVVASYARSDMLEKRRGLTEGSHPSQDWLTLAAGRYGTAQVLNENDGVERGGVLEG